ncbi:MAG: thiamine-phosphate pyrophosphorylase [Candidatus Omnitrophica bacterium]|nr:thiamine-phosphate pyrophosphorylase [Candidatus Omnitrophota bacterium]MCB9747697.1 thiamine-phosphate pyrophosphorylase [Candidatus Omnitrophota bacterium]
MQENVDQNLLRIIDANLNRVREGLRVCEDVCRFILNKEDETARFKNIRHHLSKICLMVDFKEILKARNIEADVGVHSTVSELTRENVTDIFLANAQRVKESIRVLEEFYKLIDKNVAQEIKSTRYQFYALEKRIAQEF